MKTQPTPTSPQYTTASPKVWPGSELQRPLPFPFGRVILLALLVSLFVTAGVITGLAWAIERYPQSWLTRWVPTSSRTVVEKTTTVSNGKVPAAVSQAAKTLYGLAVDQAERGIYMPGHISGLSVPLSNNGWLVTLGAALPSGDNQVVVLPAIGQPLPVSLKVTDPASPFIFLKTSGLDQTPATIAAAGQTGNDGLPVWVVSQVLDQSSIVARRAMPAASMTWMSADRLEDYWQLDQSTPQPVGSAVVDKDGHFIGLLGENSRVWPLGAVEPALLQLIQGGSIDRPWTGITYVDRAAATVVGQPAATGLLIGAPSGIAAIDSKSPAEKAGLKAGDLITVIDGQPAGGNLFSTLLRFHPGDDLTLTYERLGKKKDISLKLGVLRP